VKAEDTVMSPTEVAAVLGNFDDFDTIRKVADRQAEITWNAREELAKKQVQAHGDIWYKAGIQEVVDWTVDYLSRCPLTLIDQIALKEAMLKEWGIAKKGGEHG
jgi:hypothetical protein